MLDCEERAGAVRFRVKVQPRARRDEISGIHDGALKIKLQAPALEGRANEALCELLANRLKVPRASVKIHAGERARRKIVAIAGVTPARVRALVADENEPVA